MDNNIKLAFIISKQSGIIVLLTLIILTVLTMFMLHILQDFFLYSKNFNQWNKNREKIHQLEYIARQLLLLPVQHNCIINASNANEVIKQVKQRGCTFVPIQNTKTEQEKDEYKYTYLIENLGIYPCLRKRIGKIWYSTTHLRINIIAQRYHSAKEQYYSFLQLRIAQTTNLLNCDAQQITQLNATVLSWRYLSSV